MSMSTLGGDLKKGLQPLKSQCPLILCFSRSHAKLKSLYLHYGRAYGHRTFQDVNVPLQTHTHGVAWRFSHMFLRDLVAI